MKILLLILLTMFVGTSIVGCKEELKTRINYYGRGVSVEKSFYMMSPSAIKDLEEKIGKILINEYGFHEENIRGKSIYAKCSFIELPYACNYFESLIVSNNHLIAPNTTDIIFQASACVNYSGYEWDCWSGYNEVDVEIIKIMLKNIFLKLEEGDLK